MPVLPGCCLYITGCTDHQWKPEFSELVNYSTESCLFWWCQYCLDVAYILQVVLIISGNLSFLNWLTILPSLACFDDASIAWMFSKSTINKVLHIQTEEKEGKAPELKVGKYNFPQFLWFADSSDLIIGYFLQHHPETRRGSVVECLTRNLGVWVRASPEALHWVQDTLSSA